MVQTGKCQLLLGFHFVPSHTMKLMGDNQFADTSDEGYFFGFSGFRQHFLFGFEDWVTLNGEQHPLVEYKTC